MTYYYEMLEYTLYWRKSNIASHRIILHEETYLSAPRHKHIRNRSLQLFSSARLTFRKMDVRS